MARKSSKKKAYEFPVVVGSSFRITIPKDAIKELGLQKGDVIKVSIRKVKVVEE